MNKKYLLKYTYKDKSTNLLIDKTKTFDNEQMLIDYSKRIKSFENIVLVGKPTIICN